MSDLIVRKRNFLADWNVVSKRCVTDPECCETITQIPLPCGDQCSYSLPSTLYVTLTGQTRVPDGSYAVRNIGDVLTHLAESQCTGPGFPSLGLVWAAGETDLTSFKFVSADTFNTLYFGPSNAIRIGNGPTGQPRYLALYVIPCCQPGLGGFTFQVTGWIFDMIPQPGGFYDGIISGYCAAPFLSPISGVMALSGVQGLSCAPLLPILDLLVYCSGPFGNGPAVPNIVDITE